ncbi:hypothetical protein [Streptomyces tauricus]|uniref:hypothetical protein n=1 Tax=Streptomyces tauricus TaxID=68274 RepID=UPI0033AD8463
MHQALDNARKLHPELDYADDPIAAVQDADLLLHLTEWPQFSHIAPPPTPQPRTSSTAAAGRAS